MNRTLLPGKQDPKVDRLAGLTLFSHCSRDELRKIAGMTTEVSVATDRVLCRQGGVGSQAFVVEEGEAEVSIDGEVVATIEPGGFFGEMSLLDGGPRVATVTSRAPMRLLALSRTEFRSVIDSSPSAARALLEGICSRLRRVETEGPLT